MAIWMLGEGLAMTLLAMQAPVPGGQAKVLPVSFDLAIRAGMQPLLSPEAGHRDQRLTSRYAAKSVRVDDGWNPPARSWGDAASGPVVELGALRGASGRKRRADVVHLSLDWGF